MNEVEKEIFTAEDAEARRRKSKIEKAISNFKSEVCFFHSALLIVFFPLRPLRPLRLIPGRIQSQTAMVDTASGPP
jgi:hypothetical protein